MKIIGLRFFSLRLFYYISTVIKRTSQWTIKKIKNFKRHSLPYKRYGRQCVEMSIKVRSITLEKRNTRAKMEIVNNFLPNNCK